MSEPPAPQRFAPIALWRVASRLMVTLFNLFGEPQELAFRHTVVARDYKLICNWLRTVEALFRRLLLIEAAHYAPEVAQAKLRAHAKRQRREMSFYPEKPDEWRVTFRTMERGRLRPHGAPDKPSSPPDRSNADENARLAYLAPTTFHSAWPLAERFEALLRVHNDPAPYAKRLARRLLDATPERIASITREPPELHRRIDPEPYAEIATLVSEHAARAKRPTDTS